ncbi:nuclear transport factor 2 family protein [Bdellovibrio sp. HCB2-146]|uniref:nuclear transport factor 2 family protein n=1 Tax=Bdellovibrio sp. HCB2-146 TaxID=3394362 RepID=UPI0039BD4FDF
MQDIDVIKQVYSCLNRADVDGMMKLLDANILRKEDEDFPGAGTYRGHAEMRPHIIKGTSSWAEGACEPIEFFTNGNKVVVTVHVHVRLKNETNWIDAKIADGFVVKDGLVTEFHTFGSKEKAFKWAAISANT